MEIYNVGKYENIAERMRRLATSPPRPAAVERQSVQNVVKSKELTISQKYQGLASYKINTLKDNKTFQQKVGRVGCDRKEVELGFINIGEYIKEGKRDSVASTSQVISTSRESGHQFDQPVERKVENKLESETIEKELGKVKSQGNLKIQQILQSYNKYKLNKQQFLDGIRAKKIGEGNEEGGARQGNQEGDTTIAQHFQPADGRDSIFQPIDRIWNETDAETENAPRFELSKVEFKKRLGDCMIEQGDTNSSWREYRPRNLSKCRLICTNVQTEKQRKQEPTIKSINSPRVARVPGKICKNSTFTVTERFVS